MRHRIISLSAVLIFILTTSQTVKAPIPPKQRRLTVVLNDQTWGVLLNVLDKADVGHLTVMALRDSLFRELGDTTKNKP